MTVRTGLDRLVDDPSLVPGVRWGLLTNYTAVTADLRTAVRALYGTGRLSVLLAPEHGLHGTAQAGFSEGGGVDDESGLPIIDVYGSSGTEIASLVKQTKVDAVIADLQDVGVRYYTYAATVIDAMIVCRKADIPFYVLDRPNPLGGAVIEGPGLDPELTSLVGRINIPSRHGLTLGEVVLEAARREGVPAPSVINMEGWDRKMLWEETGLPWVMPSPNLPTPETALVYPGTTLFEGTTMSEGRGTTRPFELVGAPWLPESFADHLNEMGLPGVRFRAARFVPTFSKHQGSLCHGAQLHVTDRDLFLPVRTGIEMLLAASRLGGESFEWVTPADLGLGARYFIDRLWGSAALREGVAAGLSFDEIMERSPAPEGADQLLY